MRLRRGTTAAFLSLQNYVFRGPPPYLSKHNKFPLCLLFSSSSSSSFFSSSSSVIPPLPASSSAPFSPDLQPGRVCPSSMPWPYILLPRNALLVYPSRLPRRIPIRLSSVRFAARQRPTHGGPRLPADPHPSFSSVRMNDRRLPKSNSRAVRSSKTQVSPSASRRLARPARDWRDTESLRGRLPGRYPARSPRADDRRPRD